MVQRSSPPIVNRVAFPLVGGRVGTGSYNYVLNLVRAIDRYASHSLTPVVFAGDDVREEDLTPFRAIRTVEVVRSGRVTALQSPGRLTGAIVLGSDRPAAKLFLDNSVDVVFEQAIFYGRRFPLAVIAWIPDFQHLHLRELFSVTAYWRREIGHRAQTSGNRLVMLSSDDARYDCEKYHPSTVGRTAVVRFAVLIDAESLALDPGKVSLQYGLEGSYYYLPNQFWRHKNHETVIEAVRLLKHQVRDVVVAATGVAGDSRDPEHYDSLKSLVVDLGLMENFRFLGLVPHNHVIALMRGCTALINPSLFEGWSTAVEEAKALGVPMLLSDLRVHREQVGTRARFFEAKSATQLADLMATQPMLSRMDRHDAERSALDASVGRLQKFCYEFYETVQRAAKSACSVK